MLNYTDITQNTYIQSWTVTEIMAREVWNFDSWSVKWKWSEAYEDGTDRRFRNVGNYKPDAGELP